MGDFGGHVAFLGGAVRAPSVRRLEGKSGRLPLNIAGATVAWLVSTSRQKETFASTCCRASDNEAFGDRSYDHVLVSLNGSIARTTVGG